MKELDSLVGIHLNMSTTRTNPANNYPWPLSYTFNTNITTTFTTTTYSDQEALAGSAFALLPSAHASAQVKIATGQSERWVSLRTTELLKNSVPDLESPVLRQQVIGTPSQAKNAAALVETAKLPEHRDMGSQPLNVIQRPIGTNRPFNAPKTPVPRKVALVFKRTASFDYSTAKGILKLPPCLLRTFAAGYLHPFQALVLAQTCGRLYWSIDVSLSESMIRSMGVWAFLWLTKMPRREDREKRLAETIKMSVSQLEINEYVMFGRYVHGDV